MENREVECPACKTVEQVEYDYPDGSVLLSCQHIVRIPSNHDSACERVKMVWPRKV